MSLSNLTNLFHTNQCNLLVCFCSSPCCDLTLLLYVCSIHIAIYVLGRIIVLSYKLLLYSPQDIAIFDNLIGFLLEAYEAMYHYYLIWKGIK